MLSRVREAFTLNLGAYFQEFRCYWVQDIAKEDLIYPSLHLAVPKSRSSDRLSDEEVYTCSLKGIKQFITGTPTELEREEIWDELKSEMLAVINDVSGNYAKASINGEILWVRNEGLISGDEPIWLEAKFDMVVMSC